MVQEKQAKKDPASRLARIGDEAVRKATGKTWDEWGKQLDQDGCRKLAHKDIARMVHEKHGVGAWWSQMVTVGYEQARGLRKPNETCRGWQASTSRTVSVPVGRMFAAWSDKSARARWMGARPITVRKATKNKSMRITWHDGTDVDVNFVAKGAGKCQVAVQHGKLKSEAAVAKAKKYWAGAFGKLAARLNHDG